MRFSLLPIAVRASTVQDHDSKSIPEVVTTSEAGHSAAPRGCQLREAYILYVLIRDWVRENGDFVDWIRLIEAFEPQDYLTILRDERLRAIREGRGKFAIYLYFAMRHHRSRGPTTSTST